MKPSKVHITVTMLALAAMSSCLVSSLHPFYTEKDRKYDTNMLGNWIDGDSCIWTIHPNMAFVGFMEDDEPDGSYAITYYEEADKKSFLKATLFQLNGVDYVDFIPNPNEDHCTSDMTTFHHIPVHTLARVQYNKDSILLYWYGDEWLNELLEQNRIRIKHETVPGFEYDRQVLTAPTDELQKFIKKYANDPKTAEEIEQIFARGFTNDDEDEYGAFLKLKPYLGPLPDKQAKQVEPSYNN